VGQAGLVYDGQIGAESLREVLSSLLAQPEMVARYRQRARQRAEAHYTWEAVTNDYERLVYRICGRPLPSRLMAQPQT
jgi:glycosyltransferase involved in cell wall biosynthesis